MKWRKDNSEASLPHPYDEGCGCDACENHWRAMLGWPDTEEEFWVLSGGDAWPTEEEEEDATNLSRVPGYEE